MSNKELIIYTDKKMKSARENVVYNYSYPLTTKNEWEEYLGHIYFNIFRKMNLRKDSTIVEIGPGLMSSVAHALLKCHFKGTLYLIEPVTLSLQSMLIKYRELLPDAKIIGINSYLKDVLNEHYFQEIKINLLVGNHILDDFIIGKSLNNKQHFNDFFMEYCKIDADPSSSALQWIQLLKNKKLLLDCMLATIQELSEIIEVADTTILSAYNSHYFRTHAKIFPILSLPDCLSQLMLDFLKQNLKNYQFLKLKDSEVIQSANYWLCATK